MNKLPSKSVFRVAALVLVWCLGSGVYRWLGNVSTSVTEAKVVRALSLDEVNVETGIGFDCINIGQDVKTLTYLGGGNPDTPYLGCGGANTAVLSLGITQASQLRFGLKANPGGANEIFVVATDTTDTTPPYERNTKKFRTDPSNIVNQSCEDKKKNMHCTTQNDPDEKFSCNGNDLVQPAGCTNPYYSFQVAFISKKQAVSANAQNIPPFFLDNDDAAELDRVSNAAGGAQNLRMGIGFTNSVVVTIFIQSNTALNIGSVTPVAGRTTGGQQIKLAGSLANLSSVSLGGVSASWSQSNCVSEVTVTTPSHAVGAVNIDLKTTADRTSNNPSYTKTNAFAFLPYTFTDDTLVVGVTTAKAQHIIELRQAVDALRAVAGLGPAPWADPMLVPTSTLIKAVHITELRTYLENVAALLHYSGGSYTDPGLGSGFVIKRAYIEELRQRIRTIAG